MCWYPHFTNQETEAEKLINLKGIYGMSSPGFNVNLDLPHSTIRLSTLTLYCTSIQPGGGGMRERERERAKNKLKIANDTFLKL